MLENRRVDICIFVKFVQIYEKYRIAIRGLLLKAHQNPEFLTVGLQTYRNSDLVDKRFHLTERAASETHKRKPAGNERRIL